MKKIICFTASLASGGAEHQMLILATLLHNRGYDVTLVTCFDYPDHYTIPENLARVNLKVKGNRIHKEFQVIKYFISAHADCIISFREQINFMVLIPMLFRRKIKIIVGERNLTVGRPTFYGWMDIKLLYRRADFIVCNNYSQEEYIKSVKRSYSKKLLTIINYTEIDKYKPFAKKRNDILNVGVFCRYAEQKNYKRFAKAIKLVREKTDIKFIINWYGAIPNPSHKNNHYLLFQNLIDNLSLTDIIHLHDSTKDVVNTMSNMDAICQPSIYEGFSNSLSEGICCGKIVLAGKVSDNVRMVKESYNGFLFNPYSEQDIADAFIKFLELGDSERVRMENNSRKLAVSLFDKDKFVDSYIKLIEYEI